MILTRFCYSSEGTFGILTLPDGSNLATVERPWLDNKIGISCIPVGKYSCKPRFYHRGGYKAVEIQNVPGRSHILFHIANFPSDVQGCVGVTQKHSAINGRWCGINSKIAFNAFMNSVNNRSFKLLIQNLQNPGVLL